MFRHLSLIFRNSIRNRRRSLLTITSIAVSLCLLGVLVALYRAFYYSEATPDQALRLVTRHRVSLANPLPASYQSRIKQVPGVKEVMIFNWFGGTYKDARDSASTGEVAHGGAVYAFMRAPSSEPNHRILN